jgi:putative DNA primase/helicase
MNHQVGSRSNRIPCHECGRGPRDKTMGTYKCFRCGTLRFNEKQSTTLRRNREVVRWTDPRPSGLPSYWRELWASTQQLGGIALEYLHARGCVIPPSDSDLRWHPAMRHPTGYVGAALVALVRHAVSGEALSVHRTWISPDGTKPVSPARLLAKGCSKREGVVMLWPSEAVTYSLGLAEGIETALALANLHRPVWAAIDAGNLSGFPLLDGIESLVLAVDGDEAGRSAAAMCGERWSDCADVRLIKFPDGKDAADLAVIP